MKAWKILIIEDPRIAPQKVDCQNFDVKTVNMQTLQVLFCRSRQQNLVGVPFALPCLCLHPTDQSDERVGKHEYNLQQRILSLDELVKYAVMRTAALTNLLHATMLRYKLGKKGCLYYITRDNYYSLFTHFLFVDICPRRLIKEHPWQSTGAG